MLASALLGERPPTLPVRRLVRVAAMVGINENRARVALSRMVASGEVTADGAGRYTLAGRLAERAERLSVSRTGRTGPFDGTWHVVVVTATGEPPARRRARRDVLRRARLGELREGVWVRPANLEVVLEAAHAASVTRCTAAFEGDDAALAASVFDLAGWATRATSLRRALDDVGFDGPGALAAGFERDAEVLRHLQRDPLVPPELLPAGWPGDALRERFDAYDAAFRAALREAHRAAARATAEREGAIER